MIANDMELEHTREQIVRLETALAELRARIYQQNPERFRLMAESYLNEIEMLRARVDEYVGVRAARLATSDYVLRIVSPALPEGVTSASVLSRGISALQKGLQRIGQFIVRTEFTPRIDIPPRSLAQHIELEVVAAGIGSFEVGLRLVSLDEAIIPGESLGAAVRKFSQVAQHVVGEEATLATLRKIVPDLNAELQVLQALKELAPSRRRREVSISIAGHSLEGALELNADTRIHISRLIQYSTRDAHIEGTVREVDLDRNTFKVRSAAGVYRCRYDEALEHQVIQALDHRVRVSGRATVAADGTVGVITVRRIEPQG